MLPETHPIRLFYHKVLAVMAALYYRFPANKMIVVGVTGTKGKTSTVNLIAQMLTVAGKKVGMTSTVRFQIGDKQWSNVEKMTTSGPFALQKLLRQMRDAGCTHLVLEVSSHAMIQARVWGINFDIGVFTNIANEHLEYHGSFEEYLRAKGLFFKHISKSKNKPNVPKVAILNQDDPNFAYFDQFQMDRKLTFGLNKGTLHASDISLNPSGSSFTMHMPNSQVDLSIKLPGEASVYNVLGAAAVAITLGVSVDMIKKAVEMVKPIPGRFEAMDLGQPYTVIVDYAHEELSLEKLLELYRRITKGKLILMFGATGGGRDAAKRPRMGALAEKYADYIILTDDDPYQEDEWKIVNMIKEGIKRKEGDNLWLVPDRKEAIRLALTVAKEGDAVILAGKGGEEVQVLRGEMIPWDDRVVVRELLGREIKVEISPGHFEKRENVCFQG